MTDASQEGWDSQVSGDLDSESMRKAQGFWEANMTHSSSNLRELTAFLDKVGGPHAIDRFASMNTTQLEKYNTRFADPCCTGIDALHQVDWDLENNFVKAPLKLLDRGSKTNAVVAEFLNTVAENSDRPESALKTHMAAMKHYFTAIGIPFQLEALINFFKALVKCETLPV
ncbi:hypothetical protein RRG08_047591 [Elysia crispata]|uniref:Uncharacterized protein n=1 Tax=Elysia crispata TaxID=231223 RepID=A0AAE0XNP9_9GAST|nr:hypothetical protein RRG08_047591 [Elysia crispata]